MPNTERYSCQSMVAFSASFTVLFRSSARRVVSKLRKNSRYSLSVCGTGFAELLNKTVKDAENASIDWAEYLAVFGMNFATATNGTEATHTSAPITAGDLWKHIYSIVKNDLTEVSQCFMEKMLERGTLSSALYKALGDAPTHEAFVTEYKKLADCLAHNRLYGISE